MSETTMHVSPSYSFTVRLEYPNEPGMLGKIASLIGEEGGSIGAVDIVRTAGKVITRDFTIYAAGDDHAQAILKSLRQIPGVKVVKHSDRTFLLHLGGKISVQPKIPIRTRDDLSMAYTPGVARVCEAIVAHPEDVYNLTIKRNTVAVVTDGSAVLGLGNIGAAASLPVMEGKAMLFKELGDVDAFPIALQTQDTDEIVKTVENIAPVFGGINLEDIAAPRCFEVEERLAERLDIPVFHDDQHGTAVVTLAALQNALQIVRKPMELLRVVINGAGAAGIAIARLLVRAGVRDIVLCDRAGAIYRGREEHMNPYKAAIAEMTNPRRLRGCLGEVLQGADVFIGVSAPNVLTADDVRQMAKDPIVFAMANPIPEVMPEEIADVARIIATGRSDYPNQINNVLCFPGFFRGLLDSRAARVTEEMKLAAAKAIAGVIKPSELHEDYIVPSVFDRRVAEAVAQAVEREAYRSGIARRRRRRHGSG
ncbi:MAG: NAD-dependent malic enzyme [Armatimonadota bacterium]|nr:NAD-dependent malic enzyme [Armatimonadota bacterium]